MHEDKQKQLNGMTATWLCRCGGKLAIDIRSKRPDVVAEAARLTWLEDHEGEGHGPYSPVEWRIEG